MGVTVEMGNGSTPDHSHSHPVDVMLARWENALSAAFYIASPLSPAINILDETCLIAGAAAV